jgi:hypothetical protein
MNKVPKPGPNAKADLDRVEPRPHHVTTPAPGGASNSQPWPEPQPLEHYLLSVLPMSKEMLPDALADWTHDVCYRMRCPVDFAAIGALVMTSSVIATRVRIRPGHYDSWKISPNLWGGVVAPSGSKKTPATSEIFEMLDRLEIDQVSIHDQEQAVYKIKCADHARELKALNSVDKLRKQRLEGKSRPESQEGEATLKMQLEDLLKNQPKPPAFRRFRINDPTIEALQDVLKADPSCIPLERDELTGMLAQWEMDGHQMDRAFYLEAWNGLRGYTGLRVIRGEFRIPVLCLSLFGGIQLVKLIQYLRNPQTNLAHDGALQRFQLLVYPDSPA